MKRTGQTVVAHETIEPIVRLWILRLMIPLECYRAFVSNRGVKSDELARLLGLIDDSDELEEGEQQYNSKALRNQLKKLYHDSEQRSETIGLPQPLDGNIQRLADEIGLSEIECSILAFAVMIKSFRHLDEAADLLGTDLNVMRIYRILSVLLGFSEADIRQALHSQSVLNQTSLVVVDSHMRRGCLADKLDLISGHFAERLMSESGSPVTWLRDIVTPSSKPQLSLADYSHIQSTLDYLLPYLKKASSQRKKGVNICIHGAPGTGKTQLVKVLAQYMGLPLYEVTGEDEDGDSIGGEERLRAFRIAQAFFQQPTILLFDEIEDVFNDGAGLFGKKSTAQTRKSWMNHLLEENPTPTFWLSNNIDSIDPAFIRRFDWVIELSVPPRRQRERIIRQQCAEVLTEAGIQRLAHCEALAPAVVSRAADVIGSLKDQFTVEQLSDAMQQLMDNTLIAQGHSGLEKADTARLPACYDPELVNCDTDLLELVKGIQQYGTARICLFGPPGTGKSAYSRWLAEQLEKPLHIKCGADLLSMYVGGTEKNMARAFKEAEQDNAVLLIDEVDSFLQDRNTGQRSWEITSVNEMLTRMEDYNGVFIASTNRLDGLDSAALRRFDLKVYFDALKPAQARKLLQNYCQAFAWPDLNEAALQRLDRLEGLTPGDFAVLARQHKFRPIRDINELINQLETECALKTPYKRQRIGFV